MIPTKAPANKQIIKTHAESEREAAPIKNALMLHPLAMHAPYPIKSPPIIFVRHCFGERICLILNCAKNNAEISAPTNNPMLRILEPRAADIMEGFLKLDISLSQKKAPVTDQLESSMI